MPILNGTSGPDALSATAGSLESWTLNGLDGDDTLNGSDNNDILDGGTGADIMRGYWGFDIYYVDNAGDQVIDSDGNEIRTTLATYSLPALIWKLTGQLGTGQTLTGNYSANIITGGAGDDRLWGGAGIDQLIGGGGNDTYILKDYDSDRSDTIVEAANGGIDEVLVGLSSYTLAANVENATATGGNITLTGNNLANVLRGSDVNDSLDGGTGADTMIGGEGSDFYYVDNAGDVIVESLSNFGGTGDAVVTSLSYYQLQYGVELLNGTAATQTLVGHDGDNWLVSNGGGDTLIGGPGNDLYYFQTGDILVEKPNEGIDLIRTELASYTLPENFEDLQAISFSHSQILIGNSADNLIIGTLLNNQSDTIDGGAGADRMIGYHGSDVYYVDNVYDTIEEQSHHGTADQVRTTVDYTAPVNVEILVAWAGTGLKLSGNGLANTITGGAGNDVLIGGLGADSLEGGAGSDAFAYLGTAESTNAAMDRIRDFQSGVDQIRLAAVAPTAISWSQQTDASNGALYNLVIVNTAGGGVMQIRVDGALAMSDFVLSAINGTTGADSLTGTAGNDDLNGLGGDDVINGGAGADWMAGGAGNDTYFADNAGDRVAELAGEGYDVVAAGFSYTLTAGAHVELITTGWIDGTALINLSGNELDQQIWGNAADNLISGNDGDDTLFGFGGSDMLVGGKGKDVFFGGTGANDTLQGGLGDDTYFIDDSGDVIVENAGEGHDVAAAGVDYALGAGASIELMTTGWIGGGFTLTLTGNEFGNEIWGNDGVNAISGAAGSDALIGFGGDDRLDGGTGFDLLVGGTGQDSFVFANALDGAAADLIADFSSADDTILLDDAVFAGLGLGALSADVFVTGTAALDANDRILYDSATGQLFFDADGNGAGAAVQFATLLGNPALVAGDFFVI